MKNKIMNLFKRKKPAGVTAKFASQKTGINLPFSKSDNSDNTADNSYISQDDKKTRIGRQSDVPFSSKTENDSINCPECGYLLRIAPSASSPCPNCGFIGKEGNVTFSDSGKTKPVSSLISDFEEDLSSFRFKMVDESTGSEYKIESEETEIILNRKNLAPENKSISSEQHVLMLFRNGKIFVRDLSSNGSTFIQVRDKTLINPGTRIVLGNRIFLFSQGEGSKNTVNDKATRQLGEFIIGSTDSQKFVLIEESGRRRLNLEVGINILNRNNLDPGNETISGNKHALLEFTDGQWSIKDVSSNKATFIQLKTEMQLVNKIKLIIGNLIFRFEYN